MKGVVFNLLEDVVCQHHGEATWDALLDATGLPGTYTSLGSYPDDEIDHLVAAAAKLLETEPNQALRWFGQKAIPLLAARYPVFFDPHRSARPFILSANDIIHPEVRKLYSGAHCPYFNFIDASDGALLMGYRSARRMCALAHGFIEGAAIHYNQTAAVEHLSCMLGGDAECRMRICFLPEVTDGEGGG